MHSCWQDDWVQATLIGKTFPEEGILERRSPLDLTLSLPMPQLYQLGIRKGGAGQFWDWHLGKKLCWEGGTYDLEVTVLTQQGFGRRPSSLLHPPWVSHSHLPLSWFLTLTGCPLPFCRFREQWGMGWGKGVRPWEAPEMDPKGSGFQRGPFWGAQHPCPSVLPISSRSGLPFCPPEGTQAESQEGNRGQKRGPGPTRERGV